MAFTAPLHPTHAPPRRSDPEDDRRHLALLETLWPRDATRAAVARFLGRHATEIDAYGGRALDALRAHRVPVPADSPSTTCDAEFADAEAASVAFCGVRAWCDTLLGAAPPSDLHSPDLLPAHSARRWRAHERTLLANLALDAADLAALHRAFAAAVAARAAESGGVGLPGALRLEAHGGRVRLVRREPPQ